MRFKNIIPTFAAIAAIACSSSYAQLGSNSRTPIPNPVVQGSPMTVTPLANPVIQSAPQFGTPIVSSSPSMTGLPSSSSVQTPSSSYGPMSISQGGKGCGCCDMTPTPTVIPKLAPVTSCCGSLGPLGVPSLLTPPKTYLPPVGRQVGRPLLGKWNGF
jgi:hypothetical protein